MKWLRTTLTGLLIACAISSVPTAADAQQDFAPVDSGSVVLLADGDTLRVTRDSRLVSDAAVARMDSALRARKADLEDCRETKKRRAEQVEILQTALDSTTFQLARETAWRRGAEELLKDARGNEGTLIETLENFGLASAGFAVCRATED